MTTAANHIRADDELAANRRRLLDDLIQRFAENPTDWQPNLLNTVAAWPKENERAYDETFHYFIGGEAFNWKRLAERIATQLNAEGQSSIPSEDIFDWLGDTGVFGRLGEEQFRRILGVDGWRAHLNYFYGVHIEQCLIAAIQSRIQKRRYGNGLPPSDDSSDLAYLGLYEETEKTLWQQFLDENSLRLADLVAESPENTRTIGLDEEFTYWLFKRRIENTNAAQVADETRRALEMLSRINSAHEKRTRMLKDQNGGTILEFKLIPPRKVKTLTK
ncbi:MAG: hypothetical protein OXC83_02690 [Chloroflexi bacterium]|nr:hypothetical protein [Chloroflexota bacterium]